MSDEQPDMTATEVIVRRIIAPLGDKLGNLGRQVDAHHKEIDHAMHRMDNIENPPQPDRAEIYAALAKAQAGIQNAQQDESATVQMKKGGQFSYQYATLASVLDAVRGPLSDNGIALFQITADPGQGLLGIKTVLAHESGQTITDLITMAVENHDPRGIGSIRTYMRRYAVLAICGIAGATDDDAEAATPDPDAYERISAEEVDKILIVADEQFDDRADAAVAKMLDRVFGLKRLGDIKAGEAPVAIKQLKASAKLMKAAAKKGATTKKSPAPPEQREPGSDDEKGEQPEGNEAQNDDETG